jgi:hypothetical protein
MSAVIEAKVARAAKRLTGTPTIGADVDSIWSLREKRRTLDAESKKIDDEIASIEDRLMESMHAQGVEKATGSKASVSISTAIVANVTDWDAFLAHIYKKKWGHLLQRRVSDPAWREVTKDGAAPIPGTQAFNKKRLNLRSLST